MSWTITELHFLKHALDEMPYEVIPEKTIDQGLKVLDKMIKEKNEK